MLKLGWEVERFENGIEVRGLRKAIINYFTDMDDKFLREYGHGINDEAIRKYEYMAIKIEGDEIFYGFAHVEGMLFMNGVGGFKTLKNTDTDKVIKLLMALNRM